MDKIPLSLGGAGPENGADAGTPKETESNPIAGWFAIGSGLLGIFGPSILFVPLAIIFSVVAILRGQVSWGFAGLFLAVGGFMSSPLLMGLVGLGALWLSIDWNDLTHPIMHFFDGGKEV
ncbi:MAG: hypothetical protein O2944_07960 [Proteobacteria bacterium]|mgnify:CR=1 FL=1|nr:hypothetical protein [Pseudomonadota bacterium]